MRANIHSWRKRNRRLKEPLRARAQKFIKGWFRTMAALTSVPVIVFASWNAYRELKASPFFAVREITVEGASAVTKGDVIVLSGIYEGQNMLSFDSDKAAEAIKKNPWITGADVRRRLSGGVRIKVAERRPAAIVKMDELYLMDTEGVVFKKLQSNEGFDLPVVTGLTAEVMMQDLDGGTGLEQGLLTLIKALNERKGFGLKDISEISIDPLYGFSVYTLDEGVRLSLGKDLFEEKVKGFERIVSSRQGALKGITRIDMKSPTEAIVRFEPGVLTEGNGNGEI
ncbi:MAG: FtsQ-type POTRA domain-containing protein [Deltaproteobacteria bacterium]|nr:FtsQ-type POTRA domain-containing protein [Deltaproteobacteria bacterium]